VKEVERSLTLRLYEADLRKIMEYAVSVGLFPAPGMKELQAAYGALSDCVRLLNLPASGRNTPMAIDPGRYGRDSAEPGAAASGGA